MSDTTTPADTAQSGWIIERVNLTPRLFFSEKIGRDWGSPLGGWTEHRHEATVMDKAKAQALVEGALAHVAPHCRVVLS